MEAIAFEHANLSSQAVTIVHDPFIRLLPEPGGDPTRRGIYLLDTHPAVEGARYRHVLVRFRSSTHEPVEVIATQPINVP